MKKYRPALADQFLCTGCGACCAACPRQSIQLLPDAEGFDRPVIDAASCIGCKLCEKACPILSVPSKTPSALPKAEAAYARDPKIRASSSSGGVFRILAEQILKEGGVVCGAALTEGMLVEHTLVSDFSDLHRLQGSKYLQSQTWQCFPTIRDLLIKGTSVLYSGTPCQVAAIQSYLGRPFENLITVDLICHGAPSRLAWQRYLKHFEQQYGKASSVNFRDKSTGWANYSVSLGFSNQSIFTDSSRANPYMTAFLKDWSLRLSCYKCEFKGIQRISDLTLGDLWGIDHILPEWKDNLGTSIVFLHSEKARRLFYVIEDRLVSTEVDPHLAVQYNSSMVRSASIPKQRKFFFHKLETSDFNNLVASCLEKENREKTIQKIKHRVSRLIRGKK